MITNRNNTRLVHTTATPRTHLRDGIPHKIDPRIIAAICASTARPGPAVTVDDGEITMDIGWGTSS